MTGFYRNLFTTTVSISDPVFPLLTSGFTLAERLCQLPVSVCIVKFDYLLDHHYGLTPNDTPFHKDSVIQEHIEAGITLADAVNFLV